MSLEITRNSFYQRLERSREKVKKGFGVAFHKTGFIGIAHNMHADYVYHISKKKRQTSPSRHNPFAFLRQWSHIWRPRGLQKRQAARAKFVERGIFIVTSRGGRNGLSECPFGMTNNSVL